MIRRSNQRQHQSLSPLVDCVPENARRILDIGSAEGLFGQELKRRIRGRTVFGVEPYIASAERSRQLLDAVYCLDVQKDDLPIEPGSLDCIVFADSLPRFVDPEVVLDRVRPLLAPGGTILCSIPNLQHFSVVSELLRGDFQYQADGVLDSWQIRHFTFATIQKLFLDCGYVPRIVKRTGDPAPSPFIEAATPLLKYLGVNLRLAPHYLGASQFILSAQPELSASVAGDASTAISFIVCVNSPEVLRSNLLASPCLAPGSRHEVIQVVNPPSAADGLREGTKRARHALSIYVHQDVYLPEGWTDRFLAQYRLVEKQFAPLGIVGVWGVARLGNSFVRAGRAVDRDRVLEGRLPLPAEVETMDEIVIALPTAMPLEFDSSLGFHCYAGDICLQAKQLGLRNVVVDALAMHNTQMSGLPKAFFESAARLAEKWRSRLPFAVPCAYIDRLGKVHPR